MKGISPMIAVILLIAFTVAVGGILSVWFSTTTTSQTGITGAAATNYTRCGGAAINIDSASSTLIRFSNPSVQTISSIQFLATDGTSSWIITPTNTSLASGLAATQAWTKSANVSLTATGLCLSSVPVGGKCDNTMSCWTVS
jgi:flagellin-like protein